MSSHTAILIVGPTAVGKTAAAIALAQLFRTEILSADSRQCYREMNIGVARPSAEELSTVPHHFIASHSIHEEVNAGIYETYALEKAALIFKQHSTFIVTGGTGLYLKAFCEGIDDMPEIDPPSGKNSITTTQLKGCHGYNKKWQHVTRFSGKSLNSITPIGYYVH